MPENTPQNAAKEQRKQVFVAYSYRTYPADDYRKPYRELEQQYDVSFVFADEKITNMHIMRKIETFIRGSDFSIFDISGWNPNVTLELGFAMAVTDQWYIAVNPSKTEINEVPSDLRGLDRLQYGSYTELAQKIGILIQQRYALRPRGTIDAYLEERRAEVRQLLAEHPGMTMQSMAQVLKLEVPVCQLVVNPMMDSGELEKHGIKKSTKYYLKGGKLKELMG